MFGYFFAKLTGRLTFAEPIPQNFPVVFTQPGWWPQCGPLKTGESHRAQAGQMLVNQGLSPLQGLPYRLHPSSRHSQ